MAAQSTIGSLRVVLGADVAQFTKGLSRAQAGLKSFSANMARVGKIAATAAASMAAGIGVAVGSTLKEADKLTKMAQGVGVAVEDLSRLKHAAELSGLGVDSLAQSLGRMSRNMQDASDGLATPKRAFDQLGINIKTADGQLKSMSDIMPEVAERFASMQDGTQKTALAMVLFGRAGRELIPMLNQGSEGLRNMMQEADKLGIVITEKTGKAAESFNDNIARMGKLGQGIVTMTTAQLAPSLARLSDRMFQAASDTTTFKDAAKGLAGLFEGLIRVGATLAVVVQRIGAEFIALGTAFEHLKNFDFSSAWSSFTQSGQESQAAFERMRQTMNEIFSGLDEPLNHAGESIKRNLVKPLQEAATASQKVVWKTTAAATNAGESLSKVGQQVTGTLSSGLAGVVMAGDKAKDTFKNLGKQLASMALQKGFQMLLSFAFPGAGGLAAGAVGGGGLFSKIGGFLGFAHGGSFTVGGNAGMDNNLVAMNLSRGERVTVETREQQSAGGRDVNFSIGGIDTRKWYRGDHLRDLVEAMDAAVAHGAYPKRFKLN